MFRAFEVDNLKAVLRGISDVKIPAVITLLAVTGLTHKQSYGDIFVVTCIKTLAVFLIIAIYYLTGIV